MRRGQRWRSRGPEGRLRQGCSDRLLSYVRRDRRLMVCLGCNVWSALRSRCWGRRMRSCAGQPCGGVCTDSSTDGRESGRRHGFFGPRVVGPKRRGTVGGGRVGDVKPNVRVFLRSRFGPNRARRRSHPFYIDKRERGRSFLQRDKHGAHFVRTGKGNLTAKRHRDERSIGVDPQRIRPHIHAMSMQSTVLEEHSRTHS